MGLVQEGGLLRFPTGPYFKRAVKTNKRCWALLKNSYGLLLFHRSNFFRSSEDAITNIIPELC